MYEIYELLLEEHGVTTADVCRVTGLKESSISNWKRRNTKCSARTAEILCKFFDVPIDYLMTGKRKNRGSHKKASAIIWDITRDRLLLEAIDVYFTLPENKKKHVLDTIHLLNT